jgi:hypothetical protein
VQIDSPTRCSCPTCGSPAPAAGLEADWMYSAAVYVRSHRDLLHSHTSSVVNRGIAEIERPPSLQRRTLMTNRGPASYQALGLAATAAAPTGRTRTRPDAQERADRCPPKRHHQGRLGGLRTKGGGLI